MLKFIKVTAVILIVFLIITFSFYQFRDYKIDRALMAVSHGCESNGWIDDNEDVEIVDIVGTSYREINVLIKLKDDDAYLIITNWFTVKDGQNIELKFFDSDKGFKAY